MAKREELKQKKRVQVTFDVWRVTCDVWCVMCDVWRVTCDVWHVTCDTLQELRQLDKQERSGVEGPHPKVLFIFVIHSMKMLLITQNPFPFSYCHFDTFKWRILRCSQEEQRVSIEKNHFDGQVSI